MDLRDVVIVDTLRTAVGKFGGGLASIGADELAAHVIKEIVRRNEIDPEIIDLCVLGNVDNHSNAPNLGRLALLHAKLPYSVPGYTVEHQCASGVAAINVAYMHIATGNADIALAGGAENMSNLPYWIDGARKGFRLDNIGLSLNCEFMETARRVCGPDFYPNLNMGQTAENLAEEYNISRQEQDEFALRSQTLAAAAQKSGRFKEEIMPLEVKNRGGIEVFDKDEHPRPGTTLEKLGNLKPAFKKGGTVTAGNSSGLNDAGAVVLMMSRAKAMDLGLRPLVSVGKHCNVGVDPSIMGIAPAFALRKLFKMAGTSFDDYGLYEINEAFAAQCLAVFRELKLNAQQLEKVNVNGGAIALGHPLGASGTRLAITMIHEMQRRKVEKGVVSLCCGGGTGIATEFILEK